MDDRAFDSLTRVMASGTARRQLLAAVAAAIGVGALAPIAAGACKKIGKKCDKNKDCCSGAKCKGKKCKCKSGFTACGKACVKLESDNNHCGACDNACPTDSSCVSGVCMTADECPVGADNCTGERIACVDDTRCVCGRSTEGETICGDVHTPGALCGQCQSSADCEAFGPGAFCVQTGGSGPCCGPDAQNVCRLRCQL